MKAITYRNDVSTVQNATVSWSPTVGGWGETGGTTGDAVDKADAICLPGKTLEQASKLSDTLCEGGLFLDGSGDSLQAVNNGGVIPAPKGRSDLDKLKAEQLSHQVHGDLARSSQRLRARLGAKPFRGNAPLLRDRVLNGVHIQAGCGRTSRLPRSQLVAERFPGDVDRNLPMLERRVG